MNRLILLTSALATFAACEVGDIPSGPADAPPGVVCEQPVATADGHHNSGVNCTSGTGCHLSAGNPGGTAPAIPLMGSVFETQTGAALGGATIIVSWTGGSAKFPTGTDAGGLGNFYGVEADLPGITYPATVKVSLCPESERAMATTLKDASDLDCSKSGCHGNGIAKVYWKQ